MVQSISDEMTSQDGPDMTTLYDVILNKRAICLNTGTLWFNAGFIDDKVARPLALRRGRTLHFTSQIVNDEFTFALHTDLRNPRPFARYPASTECHVRDDMVLAPDLPKYPIGPSPRFATGPRVYDTTLTSFVRTAMRDTIRSFLIDGRIVQDLSHVKVITNLGEDDYEDTGKLDVDVVAQNRSVKALVFTSYSGDEHIVMTRMLYQIGKHSWVSTWEYAQEYYERFFMNVYKDHHKIPLDKWLDRNPSLYDLRRETA